MKLVYLQVCRPHLHSFLLLFEPLNQLKRTVTSSSQQCVYRSASEAAFSLALDIVHCGPLFHMGSKKSVSPHGKVPDEEGDGEKGCLATFSQSSAGLLFGETRRLLAIRPSRPAATERTLSVSPGGLEEGCCCMKILSSICHMFLVLFLVIVKAWCQQRISTEFCI